MIIEGNICKLSAGVILVDAIQTFTGRTKIKIVKAMEELAASDRRFKEPQSMDIQRLWR